MIQNKFYKDYIPCDPSIVALTVDSILSWVPIVGILSQTCNRFCKTKAMKGSIMYGQYISLFLYSAQ